MGKLSLDPHEVLGKSWELKLSLIDSLATEEAVSIETEGPRQDDKQRGKGLIIAEIMRCGQKKKPKQASCRIEWVGPA